MVLVWLTTAACSTGIATEPSTMNVKQAAKMTIAANGDRPLLFDFKLHAFNHSLKYPEVAVDSFFPCLLGPVFRQFSIIVAT